MGLEQFIQRWTSPHYPPERISPSGLDAAERELGAQLPADYRDAVLQAGLPRPTIALLDAIVDGEISLRDVSEFLAPSEIVENTHASRGGGMPQQLIVFATDCVGNMFCFDAERLRANAADQAAIWFFDHDFCTVEQEAPDFTTWIDRFCKVEPSTTAMDIDAD
ncbi:SMI1/KNR4 family protein [uncultured Sphingomonas sp.]|uniref:SMI1/KNR4 family protein n=1 Tax=uncultured Sphingomonas sp. TaxID=158754 RepID=UPI0025871BD1|nr:SMI1/KNR4 family protein [uncultured Sphingomonas sp.]